MRFRTVSAFALAFALGFCAAIIVAAGPDLTPTLFEGKSPREAADALLGVAEQQAGKGTWQLIAAGRVHYLSGNKEKGQALFDKATSYEEGASEWKRIARVYAEAGEFDKAAAVMEKSLAKKPQDPDVMAVLGALYNLAGKRDKAEELFRKSADREKDDFWNTVDIAGSYVGVRPQS